MINRVTLSKKAVSDLRKVPKYIQARFTGWAISVEEQGLEKIRLIPGYHDEPLKGPRMGQRSIRLNRAYRAIYIIREDDTIEFIEVTEVNKHEY